MVLYGFLGESELQNSRRTFGVALWRATYMVCALNVKLTPSDERKLLEAYHVHADDVRRQVVDNAVSPIIAERVPPTSSAHHVG